MFANLLAYSVFAAAMVGPSAPNAKSNEDCRASCVACEACCGDNCAACCGDDCASCCGGNAAAKGCEQPKACDAPKACCSK